MCVWGRGGGGSEGGRRGGIDSSRVRSLSASPLHGCHVSAKAQAQRPSLLQIISEYVSYCVCVHVCVCVCVCVFVNMHARLCVGVTVC